MTYVIICKLDNGNVIPAFANDFKTALASPSSRGRGLKYRYFPLFAYFLRSPSSRGRGLKYKDTI